MVARLFSCATIKSMRCLLSVGIAMFASTAYVLESQAGIVTFGTGANQFQMEFVTIGDPGNAPDTDSSARPSSATLGSVDYIYGIGKFEVSEDMITKFNNSQSLQITQDSRGVDKPATNVNWNEAARFVNWLNTSTGGFAAYKFNTDGVNDDISLWTASDTLDYDAANPYRSKRATYVLPSYNEWYKAAYFSPSGTYYDFANGSDTRPTAVTSGVDANTAVYTLDGEAFPLDPADVYLAGGLSPYGVMGLGGNVNEWHETSISLTNSSESSQRLLRGGAFSFGSNELKSSNRTNRGANNGSGHLGFRVASVSPSAPPVPEPSMMVIGTLFGLGGLLAKRRMKR